MSAAEAALAVAACLLGGIWNSTWPLFSKVESPKLISAVSPGGWEWENVWLPFTLVHSAMNIVYCVWAIGPATLSRIFAATSSKDLALTCIFSFLWGSGTMFYSMGVEMLGAGLGICLIMSLLVVIGTVLPLAEDHSDNAGSPTALLTIGGLLLAIAGFVTAAFSSQIKESARAAVSLPKHALSSTPICSVDMEASGSDPSTPGEGSPTTGPQAVKGGAWAAGWAKGSADVPVRVNDNGAGAAAGSAASSGSGNGETVGVVKPAQGAGEDTLTQGEGVVPRRQLVGVTICVAAAVMSSMLQFTFVYGAPLVTYAEEEEGVDGVLAPLVVWLLAFSLGGSWNVGFSMMRLTVRGTWGRYFGGSWQELGKKSLQMAAMSVLFLGHIHLYGVAQFLFGDLGPVIAWPLLMSSTVLSGQIWSLFLREWEGAPAQAVRVNVVSIFLLVCAVTVIAVAGAAV